MEESISGFKQRGDWGDIVEHGERITRALREVGVDDGDGPLAEAFEAWNDWRPKVEERLEEDVGAKTAEQASVNEGKGEKAGKTPEEDLQEAGEKLADSYEKAGQGDDKGAVESWQDSIDHVARAADSAGRKAVRAVENTVYRNVMTQIAPYYFDNELISANIQKTTRGDGGSPTFVFEVDINDDDLRQKISQRLAEYENEVDRWHVDTEKEVTVAEAAEGAEAPDSSGEDGTDGEAKSTTN